MGTALNTKQYTISGVSAISAFGFDATDLIMAEIAVISVMSDNVLICYDGTVPTSGFGHILIKDNIFGLSGRDNISNLYFAKQTNDAIVTITLEYN